MDGNAITVEFEGQGAPLCLVCMCVYLCILIIIFTPRNPNNLLSNKSCKVFKYIQVVKKNNTCTYLYMAISMKGEAQRKFPEQNSNNGLSLKTITTLIVS